MRSERGKERAQGGRVERAQGRRAAAVYGIRSASWKRRRFSPVLARLVSTRIGTRVDAVS
jgi:hypothetical protein